MHSYVQGPTNDQAQLPVEVKVPAATATNFYHNEDFSRIVGVLFQDEATKAWRIRYAEANQADELGGVVTLAGTRSGPSQLKSGMVVSVQGKLFSKSAADGSTEYLADDVTILAP